MNQKNLSWIIMSGFTIIIALLYLDKVKPLMTILSKFVGSELLFVLANALVIILGITSIRQGIVKENRIRLLLLSIIVVFLDLFYGVYYKDFAYVNLPLFVVAYDLYITNKCRLFDGKRKEF